MRKLRHSYLFLLISCFVTLWGQVPSSGRDSRAVRAVIAQFMRARNDKDPAAIRRLFTPDADQLVSTGEWRRGIDDLVRGAAASSQKETGQNSIAIEHIRFIDSDVAIADGHYQTTAMNGTARNMWTTLIVKRSKEGWRITAIRNMLPSRPGSHANGTVYIPLLTVTRSISPDGVKRRAELHVAIPSKNGYAWLLPPRHSIRRNALDPNQQWEPAF